MVASTTELMVSSTTSSIFIIHLFILFFLCLNKLKSILNTATGVSFVVSEVSNVVTEIPYVATGVSDATTEVSDVATDVSDVTSEIPDIATEVSFVTSEVSEMMEGIPNTPPYIVGGTYKTR